jgi:hypothetical protein
MHDRRSGPSSDIRPFQISASNTRQNPSRLVLEESRLGAPQKARPKTIQKTWHPGTSSRAAPHGATHVRFDLCRDESGNATVSARKGSCEIQRDGVEIQFGDPNAKRSAPRVDITS